MDAECDSGYVFESDDVAAPIERVHEGANSRVYRIIYHGRWHALKCAAADTDPAVGRLLLEKEYGLLSILDHKSVVKAVALVEMPTLGWSIVMEWIDGKPLDRWLEEDKPCRRLRHRAAFELLNALAYLHRKRIVHRDLKPSNILVDGRGHIHIIDFNLADDPAGAVLKSVSGTVGYRAPEVAQGKDVTDWLRADVFNLGMLLRSLTCGWALGRISVLCMRRDPGRRPASAIAVLKAYRRVKAAMWSGGVAAAIVILLYLLPAAKDTPGSDVRAVATAVETPYIPGGSTVTSDSDATVMPVVTENPGEPAISDTPPYPHAPKRNVVDVNLAMLRALDIRDSLLFTINKEDVTQSMIDEALRPHYEICRTLIDDEDEWRWFDSTLHSRDFYAGKMVKLYAPHSISTLTP